MSVTKQKQGTVKYICTYFFMKKISPFYLVPHYVELGTTSWTYCKSHVLQFVKYLYLVLYKNTLSGTNSAC